MIRTTIWQELEYAEFRGIVLDSVPPADQDGISFLGSIPENMVSTEECPHDGAKVTEYADQRGPIIKVWECGDCGRVGTVGKEF